MPHRPWQDDGTPWVRTTQTPSVSGRPGSAYLSQGKFTESEPVARAAEVTARTKHLDNWLRFRAESLLGASLAGEKKYSEAEPLLLEGYHRMLVRKDLIPAPDQRYLDSTHE